MIRFVVRINCMDLIRIGVISDTHGYLDPRVLEYFQECHEIWHLGDFGNMKVAEGLMAIKPLKGVYGNIDDLSIRTMFPLEQRFRCGGLDILITHIGGSPGNYPPGIKRKLTESPPDIFLCGHSHLLKVMADKRMENMLYINPGAAGMQGFHKMRTIIRFEIMEGRPRNMEVIELGARGEIVV